MFIKYVIKLVHSLETKKNRLKEKLFVAEGYKVVGDLMRRVKPQLIIATDDWAPQTKYDGRMIRVTDEELHKVSFMKTPQPVVALFPTSDAGDIGADTIGDQLCIVLDGVQDPGNLGTVIRTANAAGYEEIYLINCADPYSPKAVRASMSGIFFVKLFSGSCGEILSLLEDVPLICADMDGENIFGFIPPKKHCLCIGNEGSGISREVFSKSAYSVKIPMRGTCESLNAAVSAGIAMYALKNNIK